MPQATLIAAMDTGLGRAIEVHANDQASEVFLTLRRSAGDEISAALTLKQSREVRRLLLVAERRAKPSKERAANAANPFYS